MTCFHPITAYRSQKNNGEIVFNTKLGYIHSAFNIKCGQCWGCRLEHSRIWAIRCMHEAQLWKENQFITLTYNEENLPLNNSLLKSDLQKFWKRLRKHGKFRYYACGEYGDHNDRPHYHAIVYGLSLSDKVYHTQHNGNNLYTSKSLERVWNKGHVIIGNVTFESCAYCARYIMKKVTGKNQKDHYELYCQETGEKIGDRQPEFNTMSRRPGIGKEFYDKFTSDMYQEGTDGRLIIRGGISTGTPRYYDTLFSNQSELNEQILIAIKERRKQSAIKNESDNTPERLKVKEELCLSIINKKLPRNGVETC